MSQLSEREIEEAAREAGISPAELRSALAEQAGGVLAPRSHHGVLPASTRGTTVAHAETSLPYPPEQAVRAVKQQIEREIGSTGHMMGSTEADIYDEAAGIIYRLQAESDGAGGAMVRVDVDPTPLRSRRTLTSMGLGASVGLFAIAGLIIPGLIGWTLIAGALGLTALGATSLVAIRTRAIKDAKATMARALVEAESGAPIGGFRALPPGSLE
ncbi:MAG: hypothetical protein R6X02_12860 [Enhygromyxa sp.]